MIKLSVVIITLNEEKNIARCLDSVRSIADEIVVVDSCSTDNTKAICIEKGVTFIERNFENFVAQKNLATQAATYDFVLSMDADEELSEKLIQEIQRIKQNPLADGYEFNRLNNYCGKWIRHGGWYPDKKLRLYNRNKGKWGGIKIHEKIEMLSGTNIETLKGDLLHYTFHTISQHIETINKFSTITANERIIKNKKTNLLKIIFKPLVKFTTMYFLKLGFLDGYYGFVISINSAYATFLKEIKQKELRKTK